MKKLLPLFALLTLLFACNPGKSRKLYVLYEDADGLTTSANIMSRGLKIGTVTSLNLYGNKKIVAELTFDQEIRIPRPSTFSLITTDLLGGKAILADFSDSKTYYKPGDTLEGRIERRSAFNLDSVLTNAKIATGIKHLVNDLDTLFGKDIKDSITIKYVK
ncbi:MAG TPA: MCE family protein [Bacteroidia bacterium]|jgi:phospholipid/cholesterol/gamma-HCH transport system substrate-binding protein|nr:MCE family protein [Bacteroidia bacterium]